MMSNPRRSGSVPRGFRSGATLGPNTTAIARLYAERAALFDELIEAHGGASAAEIDRLTDAVFALDRRILAAPLSRLADLGVKARILRALGACFDSGSDVAARMGFEALVAAFCTEVETTVGSPVERARGVAGN